MGFSLFGIGKKKSGFTTIQPREYTGARPYSASDVGLGADVLAPISKQYTNQIMERSRGEGLVGFDPRYSQLKKDNLNADLEYQKKLDTDALSAKASGQGLRGGVPLTISNQYLTNYQRNRQNSLNNIDIADLEARREDINRATYAQPELVSEGAGIQQNRANFDLNEYNSTQPAYIEDQQSNVLPSLLTAGATIAGAYAGGPAGASVGGSLANSYNRSMASAPYSSYYDPFSDLKAYMRRY